MKRACAGDPLALEHLLRAVEPLVLNLALRLLGRREDALDTTQDVLLRVATHLDTFRGESRFTTWVYRIAANTITDALRTRRASRERGFAELAAGIEDGIDRAPEEALAVDEVTPEQRVAATELALVCTHGMLMALEPGQRLAYVLGEVMNLDGATAADVAGTSHAAFRQRLGRARDALRAFVNAHCGLVSETARCHCDRQLQGLPPATVQWLATRPVSRGRPVPLLQDLAVRQGVHDIRRLQSMAQLWRARPTEAADADPDLVRRVREQLASTVFGGPGLKDPPA